MTSPVLPQEVFDEIIANEATNLKSCSLVSRSFRHSAQKILFRSVVVVDYDYRHRRRRIEPIYLISIVKQAPHLIEYIQDLKIEYRPNYLLVDGLIDDLTDALSIFSRQGESFPPINLQSLCLDYLTWGCIPTKLQDTLVLLMAVRSLRKVTLDWVTDYPANLVQNLSPLLKYLSLASTTDLSSLPITRNDLPKLESLTIACFQYDSMGEIQLDQFLSDGMQRIVDTTQLKAFSTTVYKNSMPQIEQFLRPTSNSLKHLKLKFC